MYAYKQVRKIDISAYIFRKKLQEVKPDTTESTYWDFQEFLDTFRDGGGV